jgi:hypothetical protein
MAVMTEKHATAIVVLLAILVFTITGAAVFRSTLGDQWEYRIEDIKEAEFTAAMSNFGSEGWELVFAQRADSAYECIFKRRLGLWGILMPR